MVFDSAAIFTLVSSQPPAGRVSSTLPALYNMRKHWLLFAAIACYLGAFAFIGSAASQGGTPKLQTGKIYDAVYQCTRQIVKTEAGLGSADACYAEAWLILEQGKDGWYRIGDLKAGAEWYVNLNKIAAIREHVEKPEPASTPADADPGPRIQASNR